jgi:hypothetical protein
MQTYRESFDSSETVTSSQDTNPHSSGLELGRFLISFKRCTNNTLASVSLHDPWYRATANHAGIRTFRGTSDRTMGRKLVAAVACSRLIALPEF